MILDDCSDFRTSPNLTEGPPNFFLATHLSTGYGSRGPRSYFPRTSEEPTEWFYGLIREQGKVMNRVGLADRNEAWWPLNPSIRFAFSRVNANRNGARYYVSL